MQVKRIVVADDARFARKYLIRCLEMAGLYEMDVREAENGREAIQIIEQLTGAGETIDLLVTGVNMPEMGGEELLAFIKGNAKLQKIPVLVISSMVTELRYKALKELGACEVLKKPVTPPALTDALALDGWS